MEPQRPTVAPRSAMPAPPSIVSQRPMPPIVAEPPTPTRLTPVTGPAAHYRPETPTSPYEPQPRHTPTPQPEQDTPIRPELPPGREVPREPLARPRDETGRQTDGPHHKLSSAPVTAPPAPRYGYPAEPITAPPRPDDSGVRPPHPVHPSSEPTEPSTTTPAAPVSAAPVSAAPSWFAAPVSAPPAPGAAASADLLSAEDPSPAQPEAVHAEAVSVAGEPVAASARTSADEEEAPGLGWLLSLSGLGASTPEPDSQPGPETPVSARPLADEASAAEPTAKTTTAEPTRETTTTETAPAEPTPETTTTETAPAEPQLATKIAAAETTPTQPQIGAKITAVETTRADAEHTGGSAVVEAAVAETATTLEPAQNEIDQIQAEPVNAQRIPAQPVDTQPTPAGLVDAQPIQAKAVDTAPAGTRPIPAAPVDAVPAGTQPADTAPVDTEPADTEPADTEPLAAPVADPEALGIEPPRAAQTAATEPAGPPADNWPDADWPGSDEVTSDSESAELESDRTAAERDDDGRGAALEQDSAGDRPAATGTREAGETTVDVAGIPAPTGAETHPPRVPAAERADQVLEDIALDDEELEEEPERPLVDPEHVLAAYPWRLDPETLREQAEDRDQMRAVRDRLTDKLEYAERHAVRARLLSLRAVVSRILGDHVRAVADGRKALKHAQATGELRRISITQARLAHALQWRGDHAAADRMFEEANSAELPDRLRAEISELAGRSAYEQGRYLEALNHFERALDVRRADDDEMIARIESSLDAVKGRVHAKADWGPYPRSREEILQQPRPLHPTLGFESQLWGYADRDGELVVPERYADARPFHDGVAWVLRPQGRAWELIDTDGTLLVGESAGYLAVGPFADGLAWVSRHSSGGWFAIDRENRVVVAGGFDDVRAFHSGLAPVRRHGWGAVDKYGRLVVQPKFVGFATALTSGRHLDGFTDEGLAIVDVGDRKGVVDRLGQLVVPPVHAALLIHPVAFVIGDRGGRWGALDRQGQPLIELVHASQADVADEIDRLLADTRPVL